MKDFIKDIGKWVGTALNWFFVIAAVFIFILFYGEGRQIGGYSCFYVLTSSMQSVLPKNSLIIVKDNGAGQIRVGDDITYMVSETMTVTHRVVEIIENGNGTGMRAFRTKGVDNPYIDEELVYASNVIGVVVLCLPRVGSFMAYARDHIGLCALIIALLVILRYASGSYQTEKRVRRRM